MNWWLIPLAFLAIATAGYLWGMFTTLARNDWRQAVGDYSDLLCKLHRHKYTDWTSDIFSQMVNGVETWRSVQMRFCFNCHWRQVKEIKVKS